MRVTGNYAKLLSPGIFKVFDTKYNQAPFIGDSFFNVETSTRKSIDMQNYTGFGNPEVVNEGGEFPMADPKLNNAKSVTATKYGLGYEITDELQRFDQYGVIRQLPEMLADAMRYYREILAADVFYRGNTTARLAPDGVQLFSAAHVIERTGATATNIITPAALSATSLQAALQVYRAQRNGEGRAMSDRPAILLVGSANEFVAQTLLGTDKAVGSNNNDINTNAKQGLRYVVWPLLDDSATTKNAWFLLTEAQAHKLFRFEPIPLDHQMWEEPSRDAIVHRSRYMLTYDFWDWRNLVASYQP